MKPRTGKKIWAAALAATLLAAAAFYAARPDPAGRLFLWRVTSPEGAQAYLTGSIHLARPDVYPLPAPFSQVFAASGSLVVEIDTEALPLEVMSSFIARRGLAGSGRTLSDYLTPAAREALAQSGRDKPGYALYKPWLAALDIQMEALERHGLSAAYGLDKHFLDLAAARRLPIVELETFDEQMNLLADMSEPEADLFFQAALREADQLPTLVAGLWETWGQGDVSGFAELFFQDFQRYPELSGLMDRLVTRRNHIMLERLGSLLSAPAPPRFVVVGAGHLVGREGLLALLADRNFKIDQLGAP